MSSELIDAEAGGEQTQYESINTVNQPPEREEGSLGGSSQPTEAEQQAAQEKRDQGERTAENVRYGQTISEGGMSGFTTDQEGESQKGTFGRSEVPENSQSLDQTRREQGYGPGSGVGA